MGRHSALPGQITGGDLRAPFYPTTPTVGDGERAGILHTIDPKMGNPQPTAGIVRPGVLQAVYRRPTDVDVC